MPCVVVINEAIAIKWSTALSYKTFRCFLRRLKDLVPICLNQGILSVPGIADYEWAPARIDPFYKDKIFFHNTNGQ